MSHYLKLVYKVIPFLNISMHLNDIKFIRDLEVKNSGEEHAGKVKVVIQSDIPCIEPFEQVIEQIPAQSHVSVPLHQLRIKRDFVQHLTENEKAVLSKVSIWAGSLCLFINHDQPTFKHYECRYTVSKVLQARTHVVPSCLYTVNGFKVKI